MNDIRNNIQARQAQFCSERRTKERPTLQGDYTILVADDSKTVVYSLRTVLEQAGYHITVASSGSQAVNLAQELQPHLIMMDVNMPGMTGYQATRMLHRNEHTSHIPIVMISGSEQQTEQVWCKRLGVKYFLLKPIERRPLFSCLENLLH